MRFSRWFIFFTYLVVLLSYFQTLLAFNLDAEFSAFFKSPRRNAYFGYAVDYSVGVDETWILVGAPNAKIKEGEVFKCRYNSSAPLTVCDVVRIPIAHSDTTKGMLGSTIKVGQGRQVLSCAPQFTHTTTTPTTIYDLIGICYFTDDFTRSPPTMYRYLPCQDNIGQVHHGEKHSFCQAGFSAAFTKDKSKILLGAVGSYYNQGSVMLLQNLGENKTSLPIHTDEFNPVVPSGLDSIEYLRQTYDANYMGYSVATGTTASNLALLVTSAPRRFGFDLLGAVIVYDEGLEAPLANFTGNQTGESFGQGLAVADLNGDNLDDVIVGSPLYSDVTYKRAEIGRIYVYYQRSGVERQNTQRHLVFSEPTIIEGYSPMGRFGNTITPLGDVNGDGYEDILVSAPYEDDEENLESMKGTVYVFNGGKDGMHSKPSQVIHGSTLEKSPHFAELKSIKGLGYSMRGGEDVDGNGYPDVVLGAYLSDQAIVVRSRPVVKLLVSSKIKPNKVDPETQSCALPYKSACFRVDSCFSYRGRSLPPSIRISYSYDVDSSKPANEKRSVLLDPSPRNMTLLASTTQCVNETVYMKNDMQDKLSPVSVTVSYWLHESHQPVEPVMDQLADTSTTTQAEMYKDCGADDICIPELQITSTANPTKALVGAYTEIVVKSVIGNLEDNAYQTLLVVRYPEYASFNGPVNTLNTNCIDVNRTVSCEVGNPLKKDQEVAIDLKFGVHDLKGDVDRIDFEVRANCTNEQPFTTPPVVLAINIAVQADILIFNVSQPEFFPLNTLSEQARNASASKEVAHTYEITNVGPSTISSATISLLWPLMLPSGEFLLLLDEVVTSGPISCHYDHIVNASVARTVSELANSSAKGPSGSHNSYSCQTVSESCYEMRCDVREMKPKSDVLIALKGRLMLQPILASSLDSIITSSLLFHVQKFPYPIDRGPGPMQLAEVSTQAVYRQVPPPTSVDWWIIAVAIAAGVLFLLIIILVLWKCGFFKRRVIPTEQDKDQQRKLCEEDQDALN